MTEDLNQRLEQASRSGSGPQTKPDERRRFLGSLRERTLVRMSIAQTQNPKWQKIFLDHLSDYKDYTILINGKMPQNKFIGQLMSECSKYGDKFTIISDNTAQTDPDATGILVVAKTAINRMRIEINQVYAPEFPTDQLNAPKEHKHHLFEKLFGKKD
ncbi:YueI family protein [Lactobacillus sp.]|uniref:YueI family protein n=1 Tax=Lactobacillus sp. TaxID=1591 RepID=UPI00199A1D41|nr:YueI family protein [Lactobacillus sp.]MBD5430030.1 YueI family protein [Lactobacillus sp.]